MLANALRNVASTIRLYVIATIIAAIALFLFVSICIGATYILSYVWPGVFWIKFPASYCMGG